jgi:hypothetical protein
MNVKRFLYDYFFFISGMVGLIIRDEWLAYYGFAIYLIIPVVEYLSGGENEM